MIFEGEVHTAILLKFGSFPCLFLKEAGAQKTEGVHWADFTVYFGLFPCLLKKEAGVLYGSNLKHGDRFVPVEGTSPTDSFPTDWGFGIALPKSACCSRRRPPPGEGRAPALPWARPAAPRGANGRVWTAAVCPIQTVAVRAHPEPALGVPVWRPDE